MKSRGVGTHSPVNSTTPAHTRTSSRHRYKPITPPAIHSSTHLPSIQPTPVPREKDTEGECGHPSPASSIQPPSTKREKQGNLCGSPPLPHKWIPKRGAKVKKSYQIIRLIQSRNGWRGTAGKILHRGGCMRGWCDRGQGLFRGREGEGGREGRERWTGRGGKGDATGWIQPRPASLPNLSDRSQGGMGSSDLIPVSLPGVYTRNRVIKYFSMPGFGMV